nr:hypothetical protein [Tanacetum cinerariifolium]
MGSLSSSRPSLSGFTNGVAQWLGTSDFAVEAQVQFQQAATSERGGVSQRCLDHIVFDGVAGYQNEQDN